MYLIKTFFKIYLFFMVFVIFITIFISLKEKLTEIRISQLQKKIIKEREELQELRAQWNYVNNPDYLQMLVDKYLPDLDKKVKQNTINKLK